MQVTVEIQGLAELDRKLQALPIRLAKRSASRALRAGAKIIQAATKANAAAMVGGKMGSLIARFTAVRTLRMARTGVYRVGVLIDRKGNDQFVYLTKRKKPGRRYYIPAAIEFGHKTPKSRRLVTPIRFMQTAAESKMQEAAAAIGKTLKYELEQESTD